MIYKISNFLVAGSFVARCSLVRAWKPKVALSAAGHTRVTVLNPSWSWRPVTAVLIVQLQIVAELLSQSGCAPVWAFACASIASPASCLDVPRAQEEHKCILEIQSCCMFQQKAHHRHSDHDCQQVKQVHQGDSTIIFSGYPEKAETSADSCVLLRAAAIVKD